VLSHTCPYRYIPVETFLDFIDQSTVDNATEEWLDSIEARTQYGKWYCGHYHTDKTVDRVRFMFNDIDELW
jgi:3-oxoacid CoA-transferase subunit A